jgi:hypothetical protein
LIGEQISGALLKAAKLHPSLVLVDTDILLLARPFANSPMAFVTQRMNANGASPVAVEALAQDVVPLASIDHPDKMRRSDPQLVAGGYGLILPDGFASEKSTVAELATQLAQYVDLAEPFDRIHEAIREAQRIGARGGDVHGQAA